MSPDFKVANINRVLRSFDKSLIYLDREKRGTYKEAIDEIEGEAKKRTRQTKYRNPQDQGKRIKSRKVRVRAPFRKKTSSKSGVLVLKPYLTAVKTGPGLVNPVLLKYFRRHLSEKNLLRRGLFVRLPESGDVIKDGRLTPRIVNGRLYPGGKAPRLSKRRSFRSNKWIKDWALRVDRGLQIYRDNIKMPAKLRLHLTAQPAIKASGPEINALAKKWAKAAFS